jgi:hypothetical protein
VSLLILYHAELGIVPNDITQMSIAFEDDEAAMLYRQLLDLPTSEWWPTEKVRLRPITCVNLPGYKHAAYCALPL